MKTSGYSPHGFQDTAVKTHVDGAYNGAGVAQGYLVSREPASNNTIVRGIMQELEAADEAIAQLRHNDQSRKYDCRQKLYACGAALKAYMDYAYPDHLELPFRDGWRER